MAKHLSLEDRNLIAQHLNEGCSFKAIAKELGKNCSSISREVRNHLVFKQAGAPGRSSLLRLMSATAVLNATLPVLWKNDFTNPWMHGKNIRKSFQKHAAASHFPKKRFPIWMK